MQVVFSFLPMALFLTALILLDNFRLVRSGILISCVVWGLLAALACDFLNTWIAGWLDADFRTLSRYISPITEEIIKAGFIIYLIGKKKIGFMIDAAVYGFAIGAGFSLMENTWYLLTNHQDYSLTVWVIRGFGTAVMHGGCSALISMLITYGASRSGRMAISVPAGMVPAIIIHSGFNHFPVNPILQALAIIVVVPVIFVAVLQVSNARFQQWLDIEFSSEVDLLHMIRKGELRSTKAGVFLMSLRDRFSPETVVDLYCYLALYLELSLKAKSNLMLKENGFPVIIEKDLGRKLTELSHLRKQIGPLGEYTMAPLIRMNYRNLWKLNQLNN